MANESNNPLSRLLDIDFPDFKRANWNTSFDCPLTSDVGYVKPVFVDRLMAGTRASLDFDSASFANATVAPLYGRYKVKYLAFWAPDRLYMRDWLSGEKMESDDYPYHYINFSNATSSYNSVGQSNSAHTYQTGSGTEYCPPTSLMEYLGYKPSYASSSYFVRSDTYPNQCAFPFLAFWDAYRTFFINSQEDYFPVRTKAFRQALVITNNDNSVTEVDASPAENTFINRKELDKFFTDVKFGEPGRDISRLWCDYFGVGIYPIKDVIRTDFTDIPVGSLPYKNESLFLNDQFHYLLPLATYSPDTFSSFISNENVALERSKAQVKANIDGNNATFTMEQWYLASRVQSKIRKNLYKFQDFATWIDTNFGIKPSTTLTQPMFLGAFSSDVIFADAVNHSSNTSTFDSDEVNLLDNGVLGSRAGFGIGKNGNRSTFFDFTAKEPGTVMILQYIVPEVHYFEFTDPMYEKLNFNEEFNPIFDALGFQDMQKGNVNSVPNLAIDPLGVSINPTSAESPAAIHNRWSIHNSALAQQPYGFEHMTKTNVLKGMMTMPNYYQNWTLARSFNYNRAFVRGKDNTYSGPLGLYSTYILPEMYTNIFANTQNLDNFQFYLSFNYKKYQPVSKQFLSFSY